MDLASAGLRDQPFRTHGKPATLVPYSGFRAALAALEQARRATRGVTLLQGPALSGKSTLIREFLGALPDDVSVAVLNGAGLDRQSLLESLLRQFGYVIEFDSPKELFAMLRMFVLHQAATHAPPVVVIENAHALGRSARRTIGELAALRVRQFVAVRLVLAADRSLSDLPAATEFEGNCLHVAGDIHLRPLMMDEASGYLHAKLRAAGNKVPEYVFPQSVCNELWRATGGWPGILDRVALLALARAQVLPVAMDCIERPAVPSGTWEASGSAVADVPAGEPPPPPTLFVSHDGKLLQTIEFASQRLLIGRSEHNDIAVESRFVSRHHLLLVRNAGSTILMDLNSTNGTFVNSKRVSNHVLVHDDVIALGHHRLKFSDPHATRRGTLDGSEFADTAVMKTLEDMRALLARENTEVLPVPSENEPTLGA